MATHCGECPLFKHEDADGYGICNISSFVKNCSHMCEFELNGGTDKAIRVLRQKIKEDKL